MRSPTRSPGISPIAICRRDGARETDLDAVSGDISYRVKQGMALAAVAGLALAVALITWQGWHAVTQSLLAVGWGIFAITAYHLIPMAFSASAWRVLLRGRSRPRWRVFLWARWVREHVAHLLPVAQVGGEVVGARLLVLRGLTPAVAGASVVVDLTVEVLTQVVFTLIGLGLLAAVGGNRDLLLWMTMGVLVAAAMAAGFVWAQRHGLFAWLEAALNRISAQGSWISLGPMRGLHDTIQALYGERRNLLEAGLYHLVCWLLGAGEIWLILYFMGHSVGWHEALLLESLGEAIRGVAFVIPGQLGVQEGGYMLLGQLLGLPPGAGLTLSLVKRVRILLLGVPALIAWQAAEGRSLWARRRR